MRAADATRRSAIAVAPDRSVRDVAQLMEQANVGAVAIVDAGQLVGIVTDRDLVRRGMAKDLDASARVDGVMTLPVVTVDADADLHDACRAFGEHGVRRLALVRDGAFVGMLSVDDLLVDLVADLASIARPVTAEIIFGHHDSAVPMLR